MLKALRIGALAAVIATGAAAEPAPPPATIDDAGVMAWLKAYIKTEGWTLIAADSAAVVLGSPEGVKQEADKSLTTQIRHEFYRATRLGQIDSRSNLQTWNVDCKGGRMRILSMAVFEDNNLYGKSQSHTWTDAEWIPVDPSSARGRSVRRICDAPTTGQRLR
jgi:hypothetical protein